jgi:uncharacterized delta-60 repeat protein
VEPDGKILVGGSFRSLDGQARSYLGRLNLDGSLESGFDPGAYDSVRCLALQADGKILAGGSFNGLGGQPRLGLGRLNDTGTLDGGFDPGVAATNASFPYVQSLAIQEDGRILVGGSFSSLGGQLRVGLGRLNADGTLDRGFDPGVHWSVKSLVVQADGRILVGGFFWGPDTPRIGIGRLNADGTLDSSFKPVVDGEGSYMDVSSVTVQADGKILVGGNFAAMGGQSCINLARLNNTTPATQSLTCDGSTITWLRGGAGPEVWRTCFDYSADGTNWAVLGVGTRVPGGWRLTGISLPPNGSLRARGHVTGGREGSGWFVESLLHAPWAIRLSLVRSSSNFVLNWTGGQSPYQVEQTAHLNNSDSWQDLGEPVQSNSVLLPLGASNLFLRVRSP